LSSYFSHKGFTPGTQLWDFAMGWGNAGGNSAAYANALTGAGVTLTARQGLGRVPGSESTPVPAILHGGERVLTAAQARSQDEGGGGINIVFNINGIGDQALLQLIREKALPEIQRSVEGSLKSKSRFGQFAMDSRAVREVMIN
ncbi:MAG: hypothetical protein KKB38_20640, partial [Gammaproteobacteria bacterium]|nr:hypothetical protein [Gammaproteobacteria bacterium]